MKAVLALIAIYVAAFIIATQGASQNPVQASTPTDNVSTASRSLDPAKAADLRSLLESVGARDQLQAAASDSAAQYREKLRTITPATSNAGNLSDRQAFMKVAESAFQKNFDQQRAMQQIAGIYDKHYTDDEIRGLLDFFSSPLGQKFAAESPKIAREICAVQTETSANAVRESLQMLKSEDSGNETSVAMGANSKSQAAVTMQDQVKQISQRP
jgi:hypothetical protein